MKSLLILALATVGVVACSEYSPQPVSPDLDAMVASAPDWTAAEIVRDLPVDDATRADIQRDLNKVTDEESWRFWCQGAGGFRLAAHPRHHPGHLAVSR